MTDPFLSCRRLPVYEDKEHLRDDDTPARSNFGSLSETAGIKFFSEQNQRRRRRRSSVASVRVDRQDTKELLALAEGEEGGDEKKSEAEPGSAAPPEPARSGGADAVLTLNGTESIGGIGNFSGKAGQPPASPTGPPCASPKRHAKKKKLPTFDFLPRREHVVLVVDDNAVNRKIIGKMLSFFCLEYEEATNGQEALDALRASRNHPRNTSDPKAPRFGLVFMDLSMPVLDGYDAIAQAREEGVDVPIVALTANALSQERRRALDAGADEFHTKPILRNDMHAICRRFLLPPLPSSGAPPATTEAGRKSPPSPSAADPASAGAGVLGGEGRGEEAEADAIPPPPGGAAPPARDERPRGPPAG